MELSFIHFQYSLRDISCKDIINDFDDINLVNLIFIISIKKQTASSTENVEEAVELFLLRIKSIELSAHDIET